LIVAAQAAIKNYHDDAAALDIALEDIDLDLDPEELKLDFDLEELNRALDRDLEKLGVTQ
jgi:hypothetical protein